MRLPSPAKLIRSVLAVFAVVLLVPQGAPIRAAVASVPENSPVGRWKTIDDKTGKAKSIVDISERSGKLFGTIETLFDPPVPHPICHLCSGPNKDRPLVGLQIMWGFQADGSGWSGGQVLDPETGKIYHATLALEDGGKHLRLRGYIGVPLLGRTQRWQRAE
jgi:uncharacterized protein (DUF2147 family)